jgi:hypothetical protein
VVLLLLHEFGAAVSIARYCTIKTRLLLVDETRLLLVDERDTISF